MRMIRRVMVTGSSRCFLFFLGWIGCVNSGSFGLKAATVYVDSSANGAQDGSSWSDAFLCVQQGIDSASPGDEVWIAEGTYYPNDLDPNNLDPTQAFSLANDVTVVGGFAGYETNLTDRVGFHPVVLSGDLRRDDRDTDGDGMFEFNNFDNAYHVFFHSSNLTLNASAILDTVIVRGGRALGVADHRYGGGMYNQFASPTLRNCSFVDNIAAEKGGALYNKNSVLKLINCTLVDNFAENGSAMSNFATTLAIVHCTIGGKESLLGNDLVSNVGSMVTATNSIFWRPSGRATTFPSTRRRRFRFCSPAASG